MQQIKCSIFGQENEEILQRLSSRLTSTPPSTSVQQPNWQAIICYTRQPESCWPWQGGTLPTQFSISLNPRGSVNRILLSNRGAPKWGWEVAGAYLPAPATRWHTPLRPKFFDEKSTIGIPFCFSNPEDWFSSREQDDCILSRNIFPFDAWWMY